MFGKSRYTLLFPIALILSLCTISVSTHAQCDPDVPTFDVDLSSEPVASWTSSPIIRNGYCCGSTGSEQCLEFVVTLHPNAQGLVFDVCSGAIPGGALFYQVDCGPPQQVGEALCLIGVGPHVITFCKPGNNINEYCLTSIAGPSVSPDINVNEGCSGQLSVSGMTESSLSWNSISPGSIGQYNSYLDCDLACDTVQFTAQAGFPDSVQYEVCGLVESSCDLGQVCKTVTIHFNSSLEAQVDPAQPIICFGESETTISAVGIGGSPPYSFVWSTGETTEMISVEAGTYSLTVYDDSECLPYTTTVTVNTLTTPIIASVMSDTTICYDSGSVEISGEVSGVSTGEWIGGSGLFDPDATTLTTVYTPSQEEIDAGSVELILITTQTEQCEPDSTELLITLAHFNAIIALDIDSVSCAGFSNGSVSIDVSGGGAPFDYLWDDSASSNTSDISGLAASDYGVIITDVNGCDSTIQVVVDEPSELMFQALEIENVKCHGASDGMAAVSCNGGTAPYDYLWNGPTGSAFESSITDLPPGNYTLSITDASECTIDTVFEIQQPDELLLSLVLADSTSCSAVEDGSIEVSATGGVEPYTFQWDSASSNQEGAVAIELGAGSYQVIITDVNQCSDTLTSSVLSPNPVIIEAIEDQTICLGSSIELSAMASGGTGDSYTYFWTDLGEGVIQNVSPDSDSYYFVWASDENGCSSELDSVLVSLTTIDDDLSATVMNDIMVCEGDLPIILSGSVTGVTTGIWSGGNGEYEPSDTALLTHYYPTADELSNGQVTLTLTTTNTDACEPASDSVTISFSSFSGQVSIESWMVSCNGLTDGELMVSVEGGNTPYSFLWSSPLGSIEPHLTGLPADEYSVLVSDSQGCDTMIYQSITEPELLQIISLTIDSLSCFESSDGSLTVQTIGGTEPYLYDWTGNVGSQSGNELIDLGAGVYGLSLIDESGCQIDTTVSIHQPDLLNVITTDIDSTSCHLSSDGSITVTIEGGSQPYDILWDISAGGQSSMQAVGLPIGTYAVNVTDAHGCVDSISAVVDGPDPISINLTGGQLNCPGSLAVLSASASGGSGNPYIFDWSDLGQGPEQEVFPVQTTYYIAYATDPTGCTSLIDSVLVEVVDISEDSLSVAIDQEAICRGDSAVLSAEHIGDQNNYYYTWDQGLPAELGPFLVNPAIDTWYNLIVSDTCGNAIQEMVFLEVMDVPEISVLDIDDVGCAPHEVGFTVDGSHPPGTDYLWELGNGMVSQDPSTTILYEDPGDYLVSLTITYENGCSNTEQGIDTISIMNVPTADFVASTYMTSIEDAEITFTSTSSNDVELLYWDLGDGAASEESIVDHSYLEEGIYTVNLMVTNSHGCTDSHTELIRVAPVHEIIIPNAFTPSASGSSDGTYEIGALNNDIFFPWTENVSKFEMLIYNRWGELIFKTTDIKQGWNGYYKGVLSQQDVYVYKINVLYTDGEEVERAGNISLYR